MKKSLILTTGIFLSLASVILYFSCEPPTEIEKTGKIEGIVYNASSSEPIPNVYITTSPTTVTAVTDQFGKYTIEDVEPGQYTIIAVAENFKYSSTVIDVIAGKSNSANIFMQPEVPELTITPENIDFGTDQTLQSLFLINTGVGLITWTITEDIQWLSIDKNAGVVEDVPVEVQISVSRSGLDYGNYNGILSIQSTAGNVAVAIHMANPNPNAPQLTVFPLNLTYDTNEFLKSITISNTGTGDLTWTATDIVSWISLSQTSGTISTGVNNVDIEVNRSTLSPGTYNKSFTINSNGGAVNVELVIEVAESPVLATDVSNIYFDSGENHKTFTISNTGTGTLTWTLAVTHEWLTVNPTSGENNSVVTVNVNRQNMIGGNYDGNIYITSNGGNKTIDVTLYVPGDDPPIASTLLNPLDIKENSMKLQWTRNSDSDFMAYRLYRSLNEEVNENSYLVMTISNSTTNYYTNTGLTPNTTYYYRLYTIDQANQSSPSNIVSATTLMDLGNWSVMADLNTNLSGVDMYNSNFGFAVGGSGSIFFWNGTSWQSETSPTTDYLYDVQIINTSDVWTAGAYGSLVNFDGIGWKIIKTHINYDFYKVEIIDENVWLASENGRIFRFNKSDSVWTEYNLDASQFRAFQMINDNLGFAVDDNGKLFKYNGFGWSLIDNLCEDCYSDGYYLDILFNADGTGWIVGRNYNNTTKEYIHMTYYENGNEIHYKNTSSNSGYLCRALAESAGVIWFVGDYGEIKWYNPNSQKIVNYTSPTINRLLEVCFLDSGVGFAVGYGGIVLMYTK